MDQTIAESARSIFQSTQRGEPQASWDAPIFPYPQILRHLLQPRIIHTYLIKSHLLLLGYLKILVIIDHEDEEDFPGVIIARSQATLKRCWKLHRKPPNRKPS